MARILIAALAAFMAWTTAQASTITITAPGLNADTKLSSLGLPTGTYLNLLNRTPNGQSSTGFEVADGGPYEDYEGRGSTVGQMAASLNRARNMGWGNDYGVTVEDGSMTFEFSGDGAFLTNTGQGFPTWGAFGWAGEFGEYATGNINVSTTLTGAPPASGNNTGGVDLSPFTNSFAYEPGTGTAMVATGVIISGVLIVLYFIRRARYLVRRA